MDPSDLFDENIDEMEDEAEALDELVRDHGFEVVPSTYGRFALLRTEVRA